MRPLVEFLVDMLPLDLAGRRAMDETLADWRHEAGEAQTMADRFMAGVRGAAAVTVVVASVAVRDMTSAETFRIAGLVVGAAVLMSIGFSFRAFEGYAAELSQRGLADARLVVWLWALLLPPAISFCLPLSLLAPPVRRVARRSLIGPCFLLMTLSAVNLGWIAPIASERFRETATSVLRQSSPPVQIQRQGVHEERSGPSASGAGHRQAHRGFAESTAIDLFRESRAPGPRARSATAHLNSRGAMLAMVPVCLVLGVQARCLGASRRWRAGAGLLAWVVLLVGWFAGMLGAALVTELLLAQYYVELAGLLAPYRSWAIPAVCSLIALGLARLAHPAACRRDDAEPIFF